MTEEIIKNFVKDYIYTFGLLEELVENTKPRKVTRKIRYKKNNFKIQKGIIVNPLHEYILHEASLFLKLYKAIMRRS